MADRFFLYFYTNVDTVSTRLVVEYEIQDEAFVPDFAAIGYDPAVMGYAKVESLEVPVAADETTRFEIRVNMTDPALPVVNYPSVSNTDLTYDQSQKRILILAEMADWAWTQALDAGLTKASQQEFETYLATIEAIPDTDPLWATNPMSIVFPTRPTPVSSTKSVGRQIASASYLEDNSVDTNKQKISDRSVLLPEWMFDDYSLTFFDAVNASPDFDDTNALSGGYHYDFYRLNDALDASVSSKQLNRCIVKGGASYYWETDVALAGIVATGAADWFLQVEWYKPGNITNGVQEYTLISRTNIAEGALTSAWENRKGVVGAPADARYMGLRLFMPLGGAAGKSVRIDGVTIRPLIDTLELKPNAVHAFNHDRQTTITNLGTTTGVGGTLLATVAVTRSLVGFPILVTGLLEIVEPATVGATDRMNIIYTITKSVDGGAEVALDDTRVSFNANTVAQPQALAVPVHFYDSSVDVGAITYKLRAGQLGTGTFRAGTREMLAQLIKR